jgi:general secretion pathway protein A
MYNKFFGLNESPFNVNPDPRYLYLTNPIQEALACLIYGIQTRKGFVLLTGEVGTGKTTVLNKLLEWCRQERISTAFMFNPRLNEAEFFDFMMADFGITCDSTLKSRTLMKLNEWLLEQYRSGTRVVLIVDEAQNLSPAMLEEIRLLTNLETSTAKLLQIVLAGQPELEDKVNEPELRQLRQRITLWAKTSPLTLLETQGYIKQRLRIAGTTEEIFGTEAIEAVYRHAHGIPRITNLLCEHALITAFVAHCKAVSAKMVEEVAKDFDLQEMEAHSSRSVARGAHPVLVDHPSPQNGKSSSVPVTRISSEKKA